MQSPAKFADASADLYQGFIQRSPPGQLADVVACCRQLAHPGELPQDLVWRAAAAHNEKHCLILDPPQSTRNTSLLVAHEGIRSGSRAQQQVSYKDPRSGMLFSVDHEQQECTKMWTVQKKTDDLLSQMEGITNEAAEPFREALQTKLDAYIAERFVPRGRRGASSDAGAAVGIVYKGRAGEAGGDSVELDIVISASRAKQRGLCAGSWSSQWRSTFIPGQEQPAKLLGLLEFNGHYAEDSNVLFKHAAKQQALINETQDPVKWAETVTNLIRSLEDGFHAAAESSCDHFGDGLLKSFRRALPVTKEKFDWRPIRHALVHDVRIKREDGRN
eukprot:TRINITY_DN24196_c0_g1_i1.p1 TRINITY_DN24196_c0_g1~~TRINITY_DN24196_c0_g1_i1.p1  ORF type:complete len:331 (-),score=60.59 TRINITY_DN24196_c0_g1_i1:23-1015(-)